LALFGVLGHPLPANTDAPQNRVASASARLPIGLTIRHGQGHVEGTLPLKLALFCAIGPSRTNVIARSAATRQSRLTELALFRRIARAGAHGSLDVEPAGKDVCFTGHDQALRIDDLLFTAPYSVVSLSYGRYDSPSSEIQETWALLLTIRRRRKYGDYAHESQVLQ
jgi:hypothetical protein